jgi:hypothetical protein
MDRKYVLSAVVSLALTTVASMKRKNIFADFTETERKLYLGSSVLAFLLVIKSYIRNRN